MTDDLMGDALQRLPLPVVVIGADGGLIDSNEAFARLLGDGAPVGADGLAGLLLAAGVVDPHARIAASRQSPQDLMLTVGGSERPLRLIAVPLDADRTLHLFHDLIDDRDADARQAELQSLIAHDLRSPLAVIQGYAGLLATGQPGPLNATQAEFLAGIDTKIVEVTRLLDDFLDLSRLEAGRLRLQSQRVSVAEVVGQTCEELQRTAAARQITLEESVEPGDLTVVADPLRLKQVLLNLAGNAVKYNHERGWVRIEAESAAGRLEIRVCDGGPGMDAAEQVDVFTPFARGRAADRAAGSGLGLAVVQRLVNLHGGEITVASRRGEGTVFTVRLPLDPASD